MVSRHPFALKDMMRKGSRTDRTPVAEILVCSMASRRSVKSMALNYSGKSFPFAQASDIHHISGLKKANVDPLPWFISFNLICPELFQMVKGARPRLFEMAGEGLVHPLIFFRKEPELKGIITILFLRLLLNHRARTRFNNGDRNKGTVFQKDLCHPQLFSNESQCLFHHVSS